MTYQHMGAALLMYQHQQRLAAYHANLNQVLFDTERVAQRVANTLARDVFAAAVIASGWLPRVHGLNATMFHDVHSKRSWASAWGTLDGAVRAARNEQRNARNHDGYVALMARLSDYQHKLGGDGTAYLAKVRNAHALRSTGEATLIAAAVLGALGVVLMIPQNGALRFFGLCMLVGAAAAVISGVSARQAKNTSASNLRAAERYLHEYQAFLADPAAGGWLHSMWSSHPLLFNEAEPIAPTSQPASVQVHVERSVVERQVVVTRCKYCKRMTPVDRDACEHCGAPGFGS